MLIIFLVLPQAAAAKMTKAEQAAYDAKKAEFTDAYNKAKAEGQESLDKFMSDTSHKGDAQENEWMADLYYGKPGDGGKGDPGQDGKDKPQGFMGDPNDPGPTDWSDWNIKTDGAGNVIGFEEKDFEEKDADGDGEISDEEREEWNKKKEKEHEEAGGAPGEVPPIADWDKDGDGVPDKGFERWCWQCCPGEDILNECHYGRPGNCDNGGSCDISEICHPANEVHDDVEYECHTCEYMTDLMDWCRDKGYSSNPACDGQCPPDACVPVDIDIGSGEIVPENKTRERGSTRQCYQCVSDSAKDESHTSIGQDGVPVEKTAVKIGTDPQVVTETTKTTGTVGGDGQGKSQLQTGKNITGVTDGAHYQDGFDTGKKWGVTADLKYNLADDTTTAGGEGSSGGFGSGDTSALGVGSTGGTQTEPQKKTCQDMGYDGDFDDCMAVCQGKLDHAACTREGRNDDYGTPCWKCKEKGSTSSEPPPATSLASPTPTTAASDERTTYFTPRFSGFQIGVNYEPRLREEPEDDFSSETEYVKVGDYYGQGFYYIPGTETALQVGGNNNNILLGHDAFCDEEMDAWASPDCGGDCYADEECVATGPVRVQGMGMVNCYYCSKKKSGSLIDGISGATPMISVPTGLFIGSPQTPDYCAPNISKSQCGKCEYMGGKCEPLIHTSLSRNMEPCYTCRMGDRCDDYGLFCDCGECYEDEECVPAMRASGGMCYDCVKGWASGIRVYVSLQEIPIGRQVLFNSSAILQGFSPSSIMALANVDQSQIAAIQKAMSMMQGGFSMGTITELAGMMSEKLGKQRKFSDGCFSDFTPMGDQGGEGSSGGSGGQKNKGQSKSVNPGEGMPEVPAQGPIVACGQKDGKDVLAVLDAQGIPIATIFKEELEKNPQSLLAALAKAQESGQRLLAMSRMSPQDLIKQGFSKLASHITRPRDPQGIAVGATKLVPNDPLYWKDAGKKKSKVKERMKKVVAGGIGSGLKIGGVSIGGGAAAYEEDEGPDVQDQWGIRKVGYLPIDDPESAWNQVKIDGPNVVVAVIDSGLDLSHPDGPRYIWRNKREIPQNYVDDDNNGYVDDVYGWNFIDNNNDLSDYKGHGTFVTGIIAAKWNNGLGIAGINPGAIIMPLKTADAEGEATSFNIYRAIYYAVNNGARVINISLGARGVSELEQRAIDYANEKGVFVSVASGNVGENIKDHGPASALGTFPVGSMDVDGKKSTISNWGPNNGLIAPGEKIYSLRSFESFDPRKVSKDTEFYYAMSGTSFSSPMVAATASLLLTKNPDLTNKEIEDILQASADDMYDEGWDGESGAGLLNASKALSLTPKNLTTVKITRLKINRDNRDRPESVDVYATVRGKIKEFEIGAGKGERAGRLGTIAGPFNEEYDNEFVQRIVVKDSLRGSDEWIIGITAKDKSGKEHQARTLLNLE